MKLLGWVQRKLNGRQDKKLDASHGIFQCSFPDSSSQKEEFEDWPQTLLAIGTFGNNEVANDEEMVLRNQDLCIEEVIKLQNEINELLNRKPGLSTEEAEMEAEHATSSNICIGDEMVLSKSKNLIADKHNKMRQRSLSFLLKKLFVCGNGFALHPIVRDPIPESRMEKILRKILHKKIHPQAAPRGTSVKHLERNHEEEEREEDGGKWVNTDSNYIVLEI